MADTLPLPSSMDKSTFLENRLEQGELLYFPRCPFRLPEGDDRQFLFEQQLNKIHKNISLNPQSGQVSGFCVQSLQRTMRLSALLQSFGEEASRWLAQLLPRYAPCWQRDRVTLRPEEEATRPLRHNARNDLLHIDNFPTRPSQGARILRLYVNINLSDPRIWVTSETFPELFDRYTREVGVPGQDETLGTVLSQKLAGLFHRRKRRRSDYDNFMLRLHQYMKSNDAFQERCRKRYWKFPPASVWLLFADSLSHGVLRGRYALEHSYFVPRHCLALPDEAPAAIFERAKTGGARRAA